MKYILLILFLGMGLMGFSQGYPNTDSLRTYNIKYITNNAATAFTNLRLHTLLRGIIDHIDTARSGGGSAIGIDTLYALNDSTIRYRKNGVFRNTVLKGVYDTRRKVDTAYALNDSTLQIKINGTNRNIIIPGRHWTLQGVLNNGSTLTENENIVLVDSLEFTSGLVVIDSLRLRTLTTTADTTTYKPLAVGVNGRPVKFPHWPGSGGSSNFIVGDATPSVGQGINGDYFFNQQKSQWYKKAGGVWGSALGYIISDTIEPIQTDRYVGPIIKLRGVWDTAAMNYNTGSISRNEDHPGNAGLDYTDDPVRNRGWNIDWGGNRFNPNQAAMIWHDESNYKTNPFLNAPYFESHISILFKPGSVGYNWGGGGERVESWNLSQTTYDLYKYNIKTREWWQARLDSMADHTIYFDISPAFTMCRSLFKIKDITTGTTWLDLDGNSVGGKYFLYGRDRYLFNQFAGFGDTATLSIGTGGDFVFQSIGGTGRTLYNLSVGIGVGNDDGFGRAPVQLFQGGELFTHHYSDPTNSNFSVNLHNGQYGITLNKAPDRKSVMDISNSAATSYNTYWRSNINDLDSAANGLNFNIEKLYNGSFTSANLASGNGYALKLNTVSNFGTVFTNTQASNNEYTADFVWKSMYSTTMLERMKLSDTGYLYIKSLDTDNTAPATTGTTKVVISDASGLLSDIDASALTTATPSWNSVMTAGDDLSSTYTTTFSGTNKWILNGAPGSTMGVLEVNNTSGTAAGVKGSSVSGYGLEGSGASGGVYGNSSTGPGIAAQTYNDANLNAPIYVNNVGRTVDVTNVIGGIDLYRNTVGGTVGNGTGMNIRWWLPNNNATGASVRASIDGVTTNATPASYAADLVFKTTGSGSLQNTLLLKGSRQMNLPAYVSTTYDNYDVTAADLVIDLATGNVGTKPASSWAQISTATVTNTTTETTILNSGAGSLIVPPAAWVTGATYEVIVEGDVSTDGTNPATTNYRLKFGSVYLAATGAIFNGTSVSSRDFSLKATITCRSTGASGTVMAVGKYMDENDGIGALGTGTTATIDMTTNQTFDVTVTMNNTGAGNVVNTYNVIFRRLN